MQLRNMNDEAEAGLHLDATGRHTEAFQVQYAQIVLELKQVRVPLLRACILLLCELTTATFLRLSNMLQRGERAHPSFCDRRKGWWCCPY